MPPGTERSSVAPAAASIRTRPRGKPLFASHPFVFLTLPTAVILTLFFFAPISLLLTLSVRRYTIGLRQEEGLTLDNYARFLTDPFYLDTLFATLTLALGVTGLALLLGYPVAYMLARRPLRFKGLLRLAVISPLLVSGVIRTYGWLLLLTNSGVVNQALQAIHLIDEPIKILGTYQGVLIGLSHIYLPMMILSLTGVIENIDRSIEEAALSLGANRLRTFLRITLPLSLPGIAAGCMVVFSLSAAAFVTPAILGGPSLLLMSTMIYQQIVVVLDWSFGAAMAAILLVVTLGVQLVYTKILSVSRAWGLAA